MFELTHELKMNGTETSNVKIYFCLVMRCSSFVRPVNINKKTSYMVWLFDDIHYSENNIGIGQ